ncbi:MAG: hypothetical protein ACOY9Y_03540 [Bacillota bacterium]
MLVLLPEPVLEQVPVLEWVLELVSELEQVLVLPEQGLALPKFSWPHNQRS